MRKIPIILVVVISLMMINLAHTANTPDKKSNNDGEFINVSTNIESKIIVGKGAAVIIESTDQTEARVLVKAIDISQGGVVRKLLNGKLLNADISAKAETAETAVENAVALPTEFTIERAYPNPFNPIVNVRFGLPKEAPVHILIHDVTGRLIGDYRVGNRSAGWHEFSWDATDQLGQLVGTGVYLLTIQAGEVVQKQKITYLK